MEKLTKPKISSQEELTFLREEVKKKGKSVTKMIQDFFGVPYAKAREKNNNNKPTKDQLSNFLTRNGSPNPMVKDFLYIYCFGYDCTTFWNKEENWANHYKPYWELQNLPKIVEEQNREIKRLEQIIKDFKPTEYVEFSHEDESHFSITPKPRKLNDNEVGMVKRLTGVWIGYLGALYARDYTRYQNKIAPLIWEITDSGKGYLLVRRWGASIFFKGFGTIESETISFHLWEQGVVKRPRHSMAKYNPAEFFDKLYFVSETWNYGDNSEVLGIRELLSKRISEDSISKDKNPKLIEGFFHFGNINGQEINTCYVDFGTLDKTAQSLLGESSFIWQNR